MSAQSWALHCLGNDIIEIDAQLDAETDEQRAAALDELRAQLVGRLVEMAEELVLVIDAREARADILDKRAAEYRDRARAEKQAAEAMRSALMDAMLAQGMTDLPGDRASAKIAKGNPKLDVDEAAVDMDLLPDEFVRINRELDKVAILAALKAGKTVHGFQIVRRPSLRLRLG